MFIRRFPVTFFLLCAYGVVNFWVAGRAWLGLGFLLWPAVVTPLLGIGFAFSHAYQRLGRRQAILFFVLAVGVSLFLESLGVATGLVYGPYHYTHRLGALFLGLVPYVIPLTWFLMAYPAYIIAQSIMHPFPKRRYSWLVIAGLGGLVMASWDLVLDPLMAARQHWVWEVEGVYFGIPIQNYLGWWLTAFIILGLYQALSRRLPVGENSLLESYPAVFNRLAVLGYAITGLSNVIEAWMEGLVGPALLGFGGMLVWIAVGWWASGKRSPA